MIHRGKSGGWPGAWRISLWARGGYIVDMQWEEGALTEAVTRAGRDGLCRLRAYTPVAVKWGNELVQTEMIEKELIAFETYLVVVE